jgi:hypothetical protein
MYTYIFIHINIYTCIHAAYTSKFHTNVLFVIAIYCTFSIPVPSGLQKVLRWPCLSLRYSDLNSIKVGGVGGVGDISKDLLSLIPIIGKDRYQDSS